MERLSWARAYAKSESAVSSSRLSPRGLERSAVRLLMVSMEGLVVEVIGVFYRNRPGPSSPKKKKRYMVSLQRRPSVVKAPTPQYATTPSAFLRVASRWVCTHPPVVEPSRPSQDAALFREAPRFSS